MIRCLTLVLVAVLALSACAVPFPIPIPSGQEQKPTDLFSYSRTPRSQTEVDADNQACRELAKRFTGFDPAVVKKWTDTSWDSIKERFLGVETDQIRWNRSYSACMEARGYVVR